MEKQNNSIIIGKIPPQGKRRVPITVIANFDNPSKLEADIIDHRILDCILGK